MKRRFFLLSMLFFSFLLVRAEISVCPVLGNNMVLQRNTEVKLWGKANPNEPLIVTTGWNKAKIQTVSNADGNWMVKVKTIDAGGPYNVTIASKKEKVTFENILLGEVWLCSGQSNMEDPLSGFSSQPILGSNDFILNAENNNIRLFSVKKASIDQPQDTCSGSWAVASAESAANFSAVGYLFAKHLQQKLQVPVGMICSSWGGSRIEAWMNKETLSQFPGPLSQTSQKQIAAQNRASHLYNGMIAPIINYAIKGAIWYQGEANIGNHAEYPALMAAMVANWRKDFDQGVFPFYYVQIAPYSYNNSKAIYSALQRDEQLKAMSLIPKSGMVCTMDIGEEFCIHPAEKDLVAKRLFYWAISDTYGFKGISYKTPTYKSMNVEGNVAILDFNDAPNGLTSYGKTVECFELAGKDSIFYPAEMKIQGKQVRLSSSNVQGPVAVRYGYRNFPKTAGYLYNTAGLSVPSFRTDDWIK